MATPAIPPASTRSADTRLNGASPNRARSSAAASPGAGSFRVGLLGHGTVGAAFATLLAERADEIERFNGRRPVLGGVLTRSRGDFEEILADADLIVEVMGGIDPARDYIMRAIRAGRDVVSANKQLLSQYGEELFEEAPRGHLSKWLRLRVCQDDHACLGGWSQHDRSAETRILAVMIN